VTGGSEGTDNREIAAFIGKKAHGSCRGRGPGFKKN
jgi:hypothetical protein